MKITRKDIRNLVAEVSKDAISHAQKTVREDNMSYEDFTGGIVDKLDLYDYWILNYSVDDVVAELKSDTYEDRDVNISQYDPGVDPYGAMAAKRRG